MTHKFVVPLYFSPTYTSRKVAEHIAKGYVKAAEMEEDKVWMNSINVTHLPTSMHFTKSDLVILAVPVYGGHIPPIARERLNAIRGEGTPIVLVAVYGNRAFEKTLTECQEFAQERGFIPIAAAAFIGEHSYSTPSTPIATRRPDDHDLTFAEDFGHKIYDKLTNEGLKSIDTLQISDLPMSKDALMAFVQEITQSKANFDTSHPMVPLVDEDACTHCSLCVEVCPTAAIDVGNECETNPERCIRCCACVKGCPTSARTFPNPYGRPLSHHFAERKHPQILL